MAEQQEAPFSYDPLLQRLFLTPEEKASKEKGRLIIKQFYSQQTSNDTNLNYYKARNARYVMLLLWAKGSQPMQEFLDYMNVSDGNKAWVNMDTTPQRLAAQFVGTLVESMAKNKTYARVDAIDAGSQSEKENRMFDALFRMHEVETINELQQQSGIQLEPKGVYVPDDELSAKVYFEIEDRLPKEIRFEEMIALVMDNIKFDRIVNRKTIYDLTVLNLAATRIEKLGTKEYTVRRCIPTNIIYNFFMNDSGDAEVDMIGDFYNLKVKDIRSRFGISAERQNGLSEKEIYELAKLSTNKNIGTFNYMWNDTYSLNTFNGNRPYDDCSILVLDCSINCGENRYFVSKTDAFGKENISIKKNVPYQQKTKDGKIIEQDKPDNVSIITKEKKQWMRGVYAPYGDKMLYWGEDDFIINPFLDVANPLCPYTIQIPNNDGEYVPSLFERIMEPLREYSLVKLKRKQLISQIRPSGIRIDVETARNLDLGTGDTIPWEEVLRIFNQTGNEVWSSKGLDPLQREAPPISNTAVDTTVQKIVELTNVLDSIRAEIRQLIGVPQYRDGSDVGDRTSGVLQEQQETASYNVTDFVLNSNNQLWEDTDYKLCLLYWNDIVKEEPESKDDLLNTRFKVSVKMKSTEYEKAQLEKDIDRYSQVPDAQGNPSLTLKDAMMIREIEDPKLARWYLTKTVEENRKKAKSDSDRNIQLNAEAQQKSLEAKGEIDKAAQADKLAAEKDLEMFKSSQAKELALLNGVLNIASKGLAVPPEWAAAISQLVPNITIPLSIENKHLSQMADQQDMVQQQQNGQQQMQEPPDQENAESQQEPQHQEQQEIPPQNQVMQ
jgi:hypothetical protein